MRAVIVNPASSSGRTADRWKGIVERLERRGVECEPMLTSGPGHAVDLVRGAIERGIRELVVLGGDGTIGEAVAGCIAPAGDRALADDIIVSAIHQGTGGDFCRSLDIPKDDEGAIETAVSGTVRRIDAGVAHFTPLPGSAGEAIRSDAGQSSELRHRGFANCANIGMAAEVVEMVTGKLKKLGNSGAFAVAAVSSIVKSAPRAVHIVTDEGLDVQTGIIDVVVSIHRYMGGGMLVAPNADCADGMFDLVVIGPAGRIKLLRTFPKIYKGTHITDPLVRVERTAAFDIDATANTAGGVVLDGDLVGTTPARFETIPSAIGVRVPAI